MVVSLTKNRRVLILQGGGALAAYEAGVFEALSEKLSKEDHKDRPLFDIIAGTSGGAINAALLVSYFRDNRTWKGAAERLSYYWRDISVDLSEEVTFGSARGMRSIRMILIILHRMKRAEDTTLQNIFYKMV